MLGPKNDSIVDDPKLNVILGRLETADSKDRGPMWRQKISERVSRVFALWSRRALSSPLLNTMKGFSFSSVWFAVQRSTWG